MVPPAEHLGSTSMSKLRALSLVGLSIASIFASTAAFAGYGHGHHRSCYIVYWDYEYHYVCR
jgi:hypothetical protein